MALYGKGTTIKTNKETSPDMTDPENGDITTECPHPGCRSEVVVKDENQYQDEVVECRGFGHESTVELPKDELCWVLRARPDDDE